MKEGQETDSFSFNRIKKKTVDLVKFSVKDFKNEEYTSK